MVKVLRDWREIGEANLAMSRARLPRHVTCEKTWDLYRLYELVNVYGTSIKELIHEEFGDGIMSAIDFDMDLTRQPNEKGDRVKIVMTGKYLQYKTY